MNLTIASPFKVGILKGVQVLVVDNDLNSGVIYTIFLEHFGANVITTWLYKGSFRNPDLVRPQHPNL